MCSTYRIVASWVTTERVVVGSVGNNNYSYSAGVRAAHELPLSARVSHGGAMLTKTVPFSV